MLVRYLPGSHCLHSTAGEKSQTFPCHGLLLPGPVLSSFLHPQYLIKYFAQSTFYVTIY